MPNASPSAIPIAEETWLRRRTNMLTATVGSEIVMMDPASDRYLGLDDIGADIWARLESFCTFGQLLDGLAETYDAERAVIAEDVRAFLVKMIAENLIEFDPAGTSG